MDIKKLNKKGGGTVTGIVIGVLVVIAIFTAYFGFMTEQMGNNSADLDSQYNDTYTRLISIQNEMDEDVEKVKDSFDNMVEADEDFLAAWNGLKGLGSAMLLPINFLSPAVETMEVMADNTKFIPSSMKTVILIGLVALLVFILLAALTGGNPKI